MQDWSIPIQLKEHVLYLHTKYKKSRFDFYFFART